MGIFEMFAKDAVCPDCRSRGAKKFGGMLKCRNPNCPKYDRDFVNKTPLPMGAAMSSNPLPHFSGAFDPGENSVEIRYRNFRGEEQTYRGDRRTLRYRGSRISICLAPTGRRASFATKWIISPRGLEDEARRKEAAQPSGTERRVLAYHKKRGTTSPLFEKLKARYPNF
jgi:hypothetical protein